MNYMFQKIAPLIIVFVLSASVNARAENKKEYKLDPIQKAMFIKYYERTVKKGGHDPSKLEGFSVGQSHIDAAWRWRVAQSHIKVQKTFGPAVERMEKYPDYVFAASSPLYYEWVMQDNPELFEKIKQLEKEGRWEIVGGFWVEPDNNMPDGESFVRQRLFGQRFYKEHFGHVAEVSWILDSFGFNWNLPQIFQKSGAKYFWTHKLTLNDTNVFPMHYFWWEGPDGSRVLTFFAQHSPVPRIFPVHEFGRYHDTRYLLAEGTPTFTANYSTDPELLRKKLVGEWLPVIGTFYGLSDGGHGPLDKEIQIQQALQDKGYTKLTSAKDLFSRLEDFSDRAPVWNDELYLEWHRGCLTTYGWVKRANRKAEQKMRTTEILSSVSMALGLEYPVYKLKAIWKLVLLNQFHDILPGTSIPEVFEDAAKDYEKIFQEVDEIQKGAVAHLADAIDTSHQDPELKPVVVFNTLSWKRSGVTWTKMDIDTPVHLMDPDGKVVPSNQKPCPDGKGFCVYFLASDIPELGYKLYFLKPGKIGVDNPIVVDDNPGNIALKNELVKVTIDKKTGWLTSLKCEKSGKEFIKNHGNKLMAWKDNSPRFSAWNIDVDYLENPYAMPDAKEVSVSVQNSLYTEIKIVRRYNKSDITQFVRLYRDDPRVHLSTLFDFHETDTLIKQAFDTTIHSDVITAEIPYAYINRPTSPTTPLEAARWETSCQKWLDISDGEYGLALLNNGKYGYSAGPDGNGFRLSLIRGAHHPKATPGALDVEWDHLPSIVRAMIPTRITDQGEHFTQTALLPHAGDWKDARLWRAGYEFNTPLETIVTDQHSGKLPAADSFLEVDHPDVYVGAIKRAEDSGDLIIRLIEASGAKCEAQVLVGDWLKISGAEETDLLEWNPVPLRVSGQSVSVSMGPHEIKTIKLIRKQ
jgi:alpha-mannosidase